MTTAAVGRRLALRSPHPPVRARRPQRALTWLGRAAGIGLPIWILACSARCPPPFVKDPATRNLMGARDPKTPYAAGRSAGANMPSEFRLVSTPRAASAALARIPTSTAVPTSGSRLPSRCSTAQRSQCPRSLSDRVTPTSDGFERRLSRLRASGAVTEANTLLRNVELRTHIWGGGGGGGGVGRVPRSEVALSQGRSGRHDNSRPRAGREG